MQTPTKNQARRIAAALNRTQIAHGNSPRFWAIIDNDELFIGSGDNGQTKPRASTWEQAQDLVLNAESGRLTA
jgi:hypothetical protein